MKKYLLLSGMFASLFALQVSAQEKPGALTIKSSDNKNSIKIGADLQTDFGFTRDMEKDPAENSIGFGIERAGLKFSGSVLSKDLTYAVKLSLKKELLSSFGKLTNDPDAEKIKEVGLDVVQLSYFFFDYAFFGPVAVRVGKFDTPFSREEQSTLLSRSGSKASEHFNAGIVPRTLLTGISKGTGLMIHNGQEGMFEAALGVLNHGIAARIALNLGDIDGYDYTNVYHGKDFGLSIGVGGYMGLNLANFTADTKKLSDIRLTADVLAKHMNISLALSGFFMQNKTEAEDVNQFGATADLGYLIGNMIEPSARYSIVRKGKEDFEHEISGGIGFYALDNHIKITPYGGVDMANSKVNNFKGGVDVYFTL